MAQSLEILSSGDTLAGRYLIEDVLGQGGFGVVYAAHQTGIDRPVVVKVLLPAARLQQSVLTRFIREAKIAAALRHPNTVTVIDYGETEGGLPYIVMERLYGAALDEAVAAQGRFDTERVRRIISQILEALSEAHSAGVIHRDLKPSNVLLCEIHGTSDFVKVIDFGIARLTETVTGVSNEKALTATGAVIGTPGYLAPEILAGEGAVAASDLYAVGLIGIELLSGKPCYDQESPMARLMNQAQHDPVIPAGLPQTHPLHLVLRRLTARKLEDRYQHASQALADIKNLWTSAEVDVRLVTSESLLPTVDSDVVNTFRGDAVSDTLSFNYAVPPTREGAAQTSSDKRRIAISGGGWSSRSPSEETTSADPAESTGASDRGGRRTVIVVGAVGVLVAVLAVVLAYTLGARQSAGPAGETKTSASETKSASGEHSANDESATSGTEVPMIEAPPPLSDGSPMPSVTGLPGEDGTTVAVFEETVELPDGEGPTDIVAVELVTVPDGAEVRIGSDSLGHTPFTLEVERGDEPIPVSFHLEGHVDALRWVPTAEPGTVEIQLEARADAKATRASRRKDRRERRRDRVEETPEKTPDRTSPLGIGRKN